MNERIKFEAWDVEKKIMIPWNLWMFADTSPVTCYGDEFPSDGKYFILRQYIGLKDREGKEAIHYDLITHLDRNSGNSIEIVWKDGGWCGKYLRGRVVDSTDEFIFRLTQLEMSRSKIIGNIFQSNIFQKRNEIPN